MLGKGNRRAKVPLSPATLEAVHAYLDQRAPHAEVTEWRGMAGPLLATTSGGRMRPSQLWELVRRLAAAPGIAEWDRLSAHSLRQTAITMALDAGVGCATCRTMPVTATLAPPAGMTTPATASTATRPTPWPPTSAEPRKTIVGASRMIGWGPG